MNPFWALTLSLCLAMTGCYEGFKKPGGGGKNGTGTGTGGPGEKVFGLAFVDFIQPNFNSIDSKNCGNVPGSLVLMRQGEIKARIKAISSVIGTMSDQVRASYTEVETSDCLDLKAIEQLPQKSLPEIPKQELETLKNKPALHARIVLWYGDRSSRWPSQNVINTDWAVMNQLGTLGFERRMSANHFAITSEFSSGYVAGWQSQSNPGIVFNAVTVLQPAPTEKGLAELNEAIVKSTTSFAEWLLQRAQGL